LGTPSALVGTNITGTAASFNINGTVGATTPTTGAFTTLSATGVTTVQAGSASAPAITTSGDTNTGMFFPAADTIAFAEGGVEVLRLSANGALVLQGGDTAANGVGIAFPATQSASSNVNTLDDYEQGTWTPTVVGTTTAGTAIYSQQNGQYTKIGNMVTATAYVEWSVHTGTGNITLGGLPFTALNAGANLGGVAIAYNHNIVLTANNVITAYIAGNSTRITVDQYPVGGGGSTAVPMDASGGFIYTISYLAST
jgi:hypothetical protein